MLNVDEQVLTIFKKLNYYQLLCNRGYIEIDSDTNAVSITEKGLNLIDEVSTHNNEEWFEEWLKLFPTNLSKIIGYSVSGNSVECKKRMNKFMRIHKNFTPKIIIDATKMYLKEKRSNGWEFTKKNSKFIADKDGSVLEDYCQRIIDGTKSTDSVIFL